MARLYYPGEKEFAALVRSGYNLIPVWTEWTADLDTPISIYKRLAPRAPSFLLESVEGGAYLARYSFLGCDPFLVFRYRSGRAELSANGARRTVPGRPLELLRTSLEGYRVPPVEGLPRFWGGAVGYLGYDVVRYLERLPARAADDLNLPEAVFVFPRTVLVFDHLYHQVRAVANLPVTREPERAYRRAVAYLEALVTAARDGPPQAYGVSAVRRACAALEPRSNLGYERFTAAVERAGEYIRAGDVLQVVLSQRLEVPFAGSPFEVYRRLRALNPSPYMFYLDLGGPVLVGSSPEMLVRVEGGVAETRPIAGTRPRGKDAAEDELLARELFEDPKERAEHVMLVDLGRNDLGRVCRPGSVSVTRFMVNEKFSHVMHLVSHVRGELAPGRSAFDALAACFPAGTVSGAPKVRAMEIIEELEPVRRGPYAGAVGYFSFDGNMDTCITIRTIVIHDGRAYVQAGAGIVADSVPEREYFETLNKARALLETLGGNGHGAHD